MLSRPRSPGIGMGVARKRGRPHTGAMNDARLLRIANRVNLLLLRTLGQGIDVRRIAISSPPTGPQTPSVHSTITSPLRSGVRFERSITGSTRPPRQL